MDSAGIGFLLGAVPGVFLVLRNMLGHVRAVAKAKKIVQDRGERFDYNEDLSAMNGFSFNSSEFVKSTDGPGVREAKGMLLARRDKFVSNHIKGLFATTGGALIGAFIGALVGL